MALEVSINAGGFVDNSKHEKNIKYSTEKPQLQTLDLISSENLLSSNSTKIKERIISQHIDPKGENQKKFLEVFTAIMKGESGTLKNIPKELMGGIKNGTPNIFLTHVMDTKSGGHDNDPHWGNQGKEILSHKG